MTCTLRQLLTTLTFAVLIPLAAGGQTAPPMQGGPGQPGPGPGARAPQAPRNLKVLPANTDLRRVMREYSAALGVECEYCHAPADPVTHRADRASDANPMKDQARVMIQMTDDLNRKYLPLLAKRSDNDAIGCGTCHRGEKRPAAFVPPPRAEGERRPGPPPAGAPPAP